MNTKRCFSKAKFLCYLKIFALLRWNYAKKLVLGIDNALSNYKSLLFGRVHYKGFTILVNIKHIVMKIFIVFFEKIFIKSKQQMKEYLKKNYNIEVFLKGIKDFTLLNCYSYIFFHQYSIFVHFALIFIITLKNCKQYSFECSLNSFIVFLFWWNVLYQIKKTVLNGLNTVFFQYRIRFKYLIDLL